MRIIFLCAGQILLALACTADSTEARLIQELPAVNVYSSREAYNNEEEPIGKFSAYCDKDLQLNPDDPQSGDFMSQEILYNLIGNCGVFPSDVPMPCPNNVDFPIVGLVLTDGAVSAYNIGLYRFGKNPFGSKLFVAGGYDCHELVVDILPPPTD